MCGLAISITHFVHLLKRVDFVVMLDHLALTCLIKSKAEPTAARIKRLLGILSFYLFNLYYITGKDTIIVTSKLYKNIMIVIHMIPYPSLYHAKHITS